MNWRSQNVQTATAGIVPIHFTTRRLRFFISIPGPGVRMGSPGPEVALRGMSLE